MNKRLAWLTPYLSVLLFSIPIAIGAGLLFLASTFRSTPEKIPVQELARKLRVIEVEPQTVIPRATGFGVSGASNSFQAIAEVKGKIIELHPDLKAGSFIRKDELLVAIDQKDIEINIQKLKAEIALSEASVNELKTTGKNLEAAIAIEQSSLKLANRDLQRMQKLSQQNGAVSPSEVDAQRRTVLGQQQAVQNLQSSLNLLPAQIQSANASIAVSKANLAASERDLTRCRIVAPFNCRLGSVDLELNEVVTTGQQLFAAQAIDTLEIEAQFATNKLAKLIRPDDQAPRFTDQLNANPQEIIRKFFDVQATVKYGSGRVRKTREAKFERIREQLDNQARTVGIVVSIGQPYQRQGTAQEIGPPPVPGTYCEVELRGKPLKDYFVVPRSAIHGDTVYLLDRDRRLKKQPINIQLVQNNFAAITGLKSGDLVVVSDPSPAILKMLVEPQRDTELSRSLSRQAEGDH